MSDQFVASTDAMRTALKTMRPILPRHAHMPVVKSVHISGQTLTVTDLHMELKIDVAAETPLTIQPIVAEFGAVDRLLKHVDTETVTIKQRDSERAVVEFGNSSYSVTYYDPESFPFLSPGKGKKNKTGNFGLVDAFAAVKHAMSKDETRYYLNGVCFTTWKDDQPGVVATDGWQLVFKPLPDMPAEAKGKILPSEAVRWLVMNKICIDSCEFTDRDMVRFSFAGGELITKLIHGTYPNWPAVVKDGIEPTFSVNRADLIKTLNRMCSFRAGTSHWSVKLKFEGNELIMSAHSVDHGGFSEKLKIKQIAKGASGSFGVNMAYLRNHARAFSGSENLTFHVPNAAMDKDQSFGGDPIQFSGDGDEMTAILMPMKVA